MFRVFIGHRQGDNIAIKKCNNWKYNTIPKTFDILLYFMVQLYVLIIKLHIDIAHLVG